MHNKYGTEVRLIALTSLTDDVIRRMSSESDTEGLIEFSGRLCWDSTEKMGSDPSRIEKWIDVGHESVIEHPSATFFIRASRVLTHELVRHRIASYSQRSQRYVVENEPHFITPPDLSTEGGSEVFKKAMHEAWKAYSSLLSLGVKPEIARYVLPNACVTEIIMTMNFRELRHFIKLRTNGRALPEMREVACNIRDILKKIAPKVFADM